MSSHVDVNVRDFIQPPKATLSSDGYVRLRVEEFCILPLIHLLSGLDEDNPPPSSEGAILTEISGYTEWVSTTTPAVTLGWDWQLAASQGRARCVRASEPRSNVMLVDIRERDLGPTKTARALEMMIDRLSWQDSVLIRISHLDA